jgi:hypothetical protein
MKVDFAIRFSGPELNSSSSSACVLIFCDSVLDMTRTVEQVPPAGQAQVEGLISGPAEREGDTRDSGLLPKERFTKIRGPRNCCMTWTMNLMG